MLLHISISYTNQIKVTPLSFLLPISSFSFRLSKSSLTSESFVFSFLLYSQQTTKKKSTFFTVLFFFFKTSTQNNDSSHFYNFHFVLQFEWHFGCVFFSHDRVKTNTVLVTAFLRDFSCVLNFI